MHGSPARTVAMIGIAALAFGCDSTRTVDVGVTCPPECPPPPPPPPPPLDGSWSEAPAMPTPRREMPAALLHGRIYIGGGFVNTPTVFETVVAYDTQTQAWAAAPSLPAPRHHHGVVAHDGRLFVIGGYAALGASWLVQSTVFEFEPTRGTWKHARRCPSRAGPWPWPLPPAASTP
jgi:hypothetical protein